MMLLAWMASPLGRCTGWDEISTYLGVVAVLLLVGLTTWEALVAH